MSQKSHKLGFVIIDLIAGKIIELAQEKMDVFGVISVIEATVSDDYSYVDIFVTSQENTKELTKFLAKHAPELRSIISKNIKIRKIPNIRFRLPKAKADTIDVLDIINELSDKYGLNKED
ncbi:MAG: ribosome-binding factor A [Candidatus Gracilibacteria bacterium]|nr:ribosome-binding factor A [Candidatus Gracilibacteria bacterium]